MQDYQRQFIELALQQQALRFGEFTLKSGRISPYFFNMGLCFRDGATLAQVGQFYAQAIQNAKLDYDVLFGPAYKGIPLVTSTSIALAAITQQAVPYCFNRKEAKDHGEGGIIVGSPIQGNTLVLDDVITAGTAFREAKTIIEQEGGVLSGLVVALDRQERGQSKQSAIQEIITQEKIRVIHIISLNDIVDYLQQFGNDLQQHIPAIEAYREQYGTQDTISA